MNVINFKFSAVLLLLVLLLSPVFSQTTDSTKVDQAEVNQPEQLINKTPVQDSTNKVEKKNGDKIEIPISDSTVTPVDTLTSKVTTVEQKRQPIDTLLSQKAAAISATKIKDSTIVDTTVVDTVKPYLSETKISEMFISADALRKIIPIDSALAIGDSANGDEFYYYTGGSQKCPSDMVLVEDSVYAYSFFGKQFFKKNVSVCVDRFEYPNIRDRFPITNVTKFEAEQKCKSRGKRLCSDLEWVSSCKNGKKASFYPYGDTLNIYNCNTHGRAVKRTGSYRDCHTDNGVFDMVGNVSEWTDGGGVGMYGGSYKDQSKANCEIWKSKKFKYKNEEVGFRCCKDPSKN